MPDNKWQGCRATCNPLADPGHCLSSGAWSICLVRQQTPDNKSGRSHIAGQISLLGDLSQRLLARPGATSSTDTGQNACRTFANATLTISWEAKAAARGLQITCTNERLTSAVADCYGATDDQTSVALEPDIERLTCLTSCSHAAKHQRRGQTEVFPTYEVQTLVVLP